MLQVSNFRTRVKANMLFHLSVTKYERKKHKLVGLVLVLEQKLYNWLIIYSHNFCRTVLGLLE